MLRLRPAGVPSSPSVRRGAHPSTQTLLIPKNLLISGIPVIIYSSMGANIQRFSDNLFVFTQKY